jgi:hypothetical protein
MNVVRKLEVKGFLDQEPVSNCCCLVAEISAPASSVIVVSLFPNYCNVLLKQYIVFFNLLVKLAGKLLLNLTTVCPWSLPIEYLEILGGKAPCRLHAGRQRSSPYFWPSVRLLYELQSPQ